MPAPAPTIVALLAAFAPAFTARTFAHALLLLYGAILAVGPRTVAAALRAVGHGADPHFTTYHRVLNRARWSSLRLSRRLLALLVRAFLPADAPLVLVVDETRERRRGRRIAWRSWFRDPLRSAVGKPVCRAGIRWLVVALLVPVPWSARPWALPFLTLPVLAPATSAKLGKPHRTTGERTALAIRLVRRWEPGRALVLVGDGGFAATGRGLTCRALPATTLVSRLRLDAARSDPPTPPPPGKRGPKPKQGARQPNLKARLSDPATAWTPQAVPWYGGQTRPLAVATGTALWHRSGHAPLPVRWVLLRAAAGTLRPAALCCPDPTMSAEQVIARCVDRWAIEVTFEEARAHLGVETQRPWSTRAIGRTTPCLFGRFSLVVLLAHALHPQQLPTRQAAWDPKAEATFADALAAVRRHLWTRPWQADNCATSAPDPDPSQFPHPLWDHFQDLLAYAA